MTKKKEAAVYPPTVPKRPERKDLRWPSPTPTPGFPTEDAGRILKQILDRLDAIEKRLKNIEKILMKGQPAP